MKIGEKKQCSECREFKPKDAKNFYKYFRNGSWYFRAKCKPCMIKLARVRTVAKQKG